MRQSKLFTKTRREAPADEISKNAILLTRAGFIHKEMAGVYTLLPLGFRVVEKIVGIIKEEMNAIGGVQMKTSALQSKEVWEKTNRWSDEVVDNWFKTTFKNGGEVGLSFTNEEAYSNILKNYISSYKDLPLNLYDFKTIFRNETRAKSGIMRGREFYWKAMYSFSTDHESHNVFYEKAKNAYLNIFNRVGLGDRTYLAFASGGSFSKYSHEFQTISDAGEDVVHVSASKKLAINDEVLTEEVIRDLGINKDELESKKAVEIGNIFTLGAKFSEPFNLTYKNENGSEVPVFMGSYGIGVTRLLGVIAEVLSDEKGLSWPVEVAPFRVHLISLGENARELSEEIYKTLTANGIETLFDDRDLRAGEKFADSDLIGIPTRIVVGEKALESKMLEVKDRATQETRMLTIEHLLAELKK